MISGVISSLECRQGTLSVTGARSPMKSHSAPRGGTEIRLGCQEKHSTKGEKMRWKEARLAILGLVLVSSLACQLLTPELAEDEEGLKATISAQRTVIARQAAELGVTVEAPAINESPQASESSEYPSLLWEMELTEEPLVDDTAVYYIDEEDKVVCLNLANGGITWAWQYYERAVRLLGQTEKLVFALREDHRIYALDKGTGETRWKYRFDEENSVEVSIVDKLLYLGILGDWVAYGSLLAFDAQTGQMLWEQRRVRTDWQATPNYAYVIAPGQDEGVAQLLDAETGEVIAAIEGVDRIVKCEDCLTYDIIFLRRGISAGDSTVFAVDYPSWQVKWEHLGHYADITEGATLLHVLQDGDYACLAVATGTGRELWPEPQVSQFKYLEAVDQLAFFYSDGLGETRALDVKTGNTVWTNDELKVDWVIPQKLDGVLMANRERGQLFYVDRETGKIKWRLTHEEDFGPVYVCDIKILNNEFLASIGSDLYVIDLQTGEIKWQKELGSLREDVRQLRVLEGKVVMMSSEHIAVLEY